MSEVDFSKLRLIPLKIGTFFEVEEGFE